MDKNILLEALITEREGMLAENVQRLDHGYNLAYGEEAFQKLADQMRELASEPSVEDGQANVCAHCGGIEREGEAGRCPYCGGP